MIDTTYWVNGVPLDDENQRWVLAADNPLTPTAAVRVAPVAVPGAHGKTFGWDEPYDSVDHGLRIAVTSNDAFGEDGGWDQLIANITFLQGLFANRHEPLELTRRQGGITCRKGARLTASTQPEYMDRRTAVMTMVVTEDPFWIETTERKCATPLFTAQAVAWTLSELNGGSAPVGDLIFTAPGPLTQLRVRDMFTGHEMVVTVDVVAGQLLTVVPGKYQATVTDEQGRGADVSYALDTPVHGFELVPGYDATVRQMTYRMAGVRAGGDGIINVYGRRAYL